MRPSDVQLSISLLNCNWMAITAGDIAQCPGDQFTRSGFIVKSSAPLATIMATNICKVRGLKSAWWCAHPSWWWTQRSNWNVEKGFEVWSCLEVGFLIPTFLPL